MEANASSKSATDTETASPTAHVGSVVRILRIECVMDPPKAVRPIPIEVACSETKTVMDPSLNELIGSKTVISTLAITTSEGANIPEVLPIRGLTSSLAMSI